MSGGPKRREAPATVLLVGMGTSIVLNRNSPMLNDTRLCLKAR